jgi:hypothetical protein
MEAGVLEALRDACIETASIGRRCIGAWSTKGPSDRARLV